MGTIFIIVCGLIGAFTAGKQSFFACWRFLIHFSFALYSAFFLSPLVVPLLEIPGLSDGIKNILSVCVICLIFYLVLKKISEMVFPGSGDDLPLPALPAKLGAIFSGVLSGILAGGLAVYVVIQLPFLDMIPETVQGNLRSSCRQTLRGMIRTINIFSLQSLTPAGKEDLRLVGLFAKKQEPKPSAGPRDEKPAEAGKKE